MLIKHTGTITKVAEDIFTKFKIVQATNAVKAMPLLVNHWITNSFCCARGLRNDLGGVVRVYRNDLDDVERKNAGTKKTVAAKIIAPKVIKAATLMNHNVVDKSDIRRGAPKFDK
jgi:geranylgeranyl pyrophosphate synthase